MPVADHLIGPVRKLPFGGRWVGLAEVVDNLPPAEFGERESLLESFLGTGWVLGVPQAAHGAIQPQGPKGKFTTDGVCHRSDY